MMNLVHLALVLVTIMAYVVGCDPSVDSWPTQFHNVAPFHFHNVAPFQL